MEPRTIRRPKAAMRSRTAPSPSSRWFLALAPLVAFAACASNPPRASSEPVHSRAPAPTCSTPADADRCRAETTLRALLERLEIPAERAETMNALRRSFDAARARGAPPDGVDHPDARHWLDHAMPSI